LVDEDEKGEAKVILAGKDHLVYSTVYFGEVERLAQVVQAMDVFTGDLVQK
jgi:hypothetical protein